MLRKKKFEQELGDELRSYAELQAAEMIRRVMSPEEALGQARRELGGMDQVKENIRDVRPGVFMDMLIQDIRYAFRTLQRNRAFAFVAILTLALGIGANTAILTVADAAVLKPLPYPDPDRLLTLRERSLSDGLKGTVPPANFYDWREQSRSFGKTAAFGPYSDFILKGSGEPWRLTGADVAARAQARPGSLRRVGVAPAAEGPEAAVAGIRVHIQALLSRRQPELFAKHLNSVLALCEEDVLKLQFAGTQRDEQAKELLGYLKAIETGLSNDGDKPETYLVEGKRSLTVARLSRSDGTLQFYTVSLPPHWDPKKVYPLHVALHGRGPDIPLAYVHYTFLPHEKDERRADEVISIVPWLRGNGDWRNANGSEPDIWEAIDDVKSFAKLNPDRLYISGHSWGGDDVWAIVQRTPDLWAAAGIMAGDPGSAPSELGLLPNARYVPFYLWLGDQDPIPTRRPAFEYFRDALTAVGDPPKLVVAHGVGHNPRPQDSTALQSWLFEHVRRRPNHFSFVIDTPQHRGIWGISVPPKYPSGYGNVEPRVSFECWLEGATVRIQTRDAKKLEVDLGPNGLNIPGTVTLIVNGKTRFTGPVPEKPFSLDF